MDLSLSPRNRYLCVSVSSWDGTSSLAITPPPGYQGSSASRRDSKARNKAGSKTKGTPATVPPPAQTNPVAYVIDLSSGSCVGALSGFPGDIRRICFQTPGFGAKIFTGGVDGEIRVWDGPEGRKPLAARQRLSMNSPVTGLAVSEDGRLVLGSDQSGNVRLWVCN